mmetsp:Transcript_52917/g.97654  ORF Transcript_52917/g.97654 Transcript_52917/m.97654 type:complete len:493 (+) Transcript_52917:1-1479(+)
MLAQAFELKLTGPAGPVLLFPTILDAMSSKVLLLALLGVPAGAQIGLPPGTVDVPITRFGDCKGSPDDLPGSFVYRLSQQAPNDYFPHVCPKMGGTEVHFNNPCKWAHGRAQMTMAHFTNMCKGATRVIHWHHQADEWGFVTSGRLQAFVASPDGLPWTSSNNVLLDRGVWYFPAGWLHGLMCLTPEEEGGCEFWIGFASPQAAEPNGHNLGTTFAQAPGHVSAAALDVTLESYLSSLPSFAGTAKAVHYSNSNMTSPIVTPVAPGACEPHCPPVKETYAEPAAMQAAQAEVPVFLHGAKGVKLHRIKTSTFPFARTMSQERAELAPGATRPMVWATADSILMIVAGTVTVSIEGGIFGEESHLPYVNETIGKGDVAYIPNGRAFWFTEATGTTTAETVQVFNVGEWKSIEMSQQVGEMPQIVVDSNLNLGHGMLRAKASSQMLADEDAQSTLTISGLVAVGSVAVGFAAITLILMKRRQSQVSEHSFRSLL